MELKDRIRRAREAAGLTQAELAERVGKDPKTVRNWEAGRAPRSAIGAIERVLGVDLSAPADRPPSPTLDEATDAQVLANLAGRLADRDRRLAERERVIAELRAELSSVRGDEPATRMGRFAARVREEADEDS